MKGKGLSFEVIVDAALELVKEKGYNQFSVRELASVLHVKAASLYNHLNSIDEINIEIGKRAAQDMNAQLDLAVNGYKREKAIEALAYSYRDYVKNNYQMYRALMALPSLDSGDGKVLASGRAGIDTIRRVMGDYQVDDVIKLHFSRCLRSALDGFTQMEMSGYFTGGRANSEESFRFLVSGYAEWIAAMERQG